jgi:hypothetical protein
MIRTVRAWSGEPSTGDESPDIGPALIWMPGVGIVCLLPEEFNQTSARNQSATRSPIMMQVKLVLARTILGITNASITRSRSTPRTRQY